MNRTMEVVIAGVLLFAGGSLAGRLIQPREAAGDPESWTDVGSPGESTTAGHNNFLRTAAPSDQTVVSNDSRAAVTEYRTIAQTAAFFVDESNDELPENGIRKPADRETGESARQQLERHFPEIDGETAEIWRENYADIAAADVEFLLEQHQHLRTSLPDSIFSDFAADVVSSTSDDAADVADQGDSPGRSLQSSEAATTTATTATRRRSVEHDTNGRHDSAIRTTIGLRSRTVLTLSESLRPARPDDACIAERTVFDFAPGPLVRTGAALDVGIDGHPDLMFLLEPGNLVTRCGLFQRLDDGRLGFLAADGSRALSNSPVIPEPAQAPTIDDSGRLTYEIDGTLIEGGRIAVVRIDEPHRLHSDDGVVFSIPPSCQPPVLVEAAGILRAGWLEVANTAP